MKKEKRYAVYTGIYPSLEEQKSDFRLDYIRLDPIKEKGYVIGQNKSGRLSIKKVYKMPKEFSEKYLAVKIKLVNAGELEAFLKLAFRRMDESKIFENRAEDAKSNAVSLLEKIQSRIDFSEEKR